MSTLASGSISFSDDRTVFGFGKYKNKGFEVALGDPKYMVWLSTKTEAPYMTDSLKGFLATHSVSKPEELEPKAKKCVIPRKVTVAAPKCCPHCLGDL